MTDVEIAIFIFLSLFVFITFVDLYSFLKMRVRVEDLEKQIAHISKTSAEFFCATNNRIADISEAFESCDVNIDTLFDEKDKINESIIDLKRSVECVNCKLSNPLTRFMK